MSNKSFLNAESLRDAIDNTDCLIRQAIVDGDFLEVLKKLTPVIVGDIL